VYTEALALGMESSTTREVSTSGRAAWRAPSRRAQA